MAMLRSLGSTSLTTRPSISSLPSVIVSSPATIRSKVDLPQPDGPSSTRNSPSATRQSMPWITCMSPYDFLTPAMFTSATLFLRLDEAAHELPLHHNNDDDRRDHRQHRRAHHPAPVGRAVEHVHHPGDAHDDRVVALVCGDQERPQILVPAVDELDHEQRRDGGA